MKKMFKKILNLFSKRKKIPQFWAGFRPMTVHRTKKFRPPFQFRGRGRSFPYILGGHQSAATNQEVEGKRLLSSQCSLGSAPTLPPTRAVRKAQPMLACWQISVRSDLPFTGDMVIGGDLSVALFRSVVWKTDPPLTIIQGDVTQHYMTIRQSNYEIAQTFTLYALKCFASYQ